MKQIVSMLLGVIASASVMPISAGTFSGELKLYPPECQKTESKICKLEGLLTYTSSRDGLVWQTDEWQDGNGQSGTTDGASIPKWAQPIIGDQYDESYLKAAIIHDHYCYKENHVRTWRATHRMFYDALIDLDVNPIKAKVMYFAVYWRGPKWINLVPGEKCGHNCIKRILPSSIRWDGDGYGGDGFEEQLAQIKKVIVKNPEITLEELEDVARSITPNKFFFEHDDSYIPNGPSDPNAFPAR